MTRSTQVERAAPCLRRFSGAQPVAASRRARPMRPRDSVHVVVRGYRGSRLVGAPYLSKAPVEGTSRFLDLPTMSPSGD